MFTGLIQTIGTIQSLGGDQLQISCRLAEAAWMGDMEIGDSIAVDGICLTVTQILTGGFIAAASPETLSRTTLEHLQGNAYVNLEPSLRVGSKLGGHFVTGHVDGTGRLQTAVSTDNSWEMTFAVADARVACYIVPKGSIAVNGISLTVADCSPDGSWFTVAVIPLTYSDTNLKLLKPNSLVNLEGDVLGKYVEKFLRLGPASEGEPAPIGWPQGMGDGVTPDFLAEHGYL